MFDSIKNWLNKADDHHADRKALEAEGNQFKLPSETLPQIFKYLFFIGLAFLNYRLFAHAVPGNWGVATGILAMMAEAIALYATHNFSRSSGAFRYALGGAGTVLMIFSLVHGTFSILDLIRVMSMTPTIRWYSHVVAFPLLAGLVGLSVIALTMTHPKNIVRLKQAHGHTQIATNRAETASELLMMRSQRAIEHARLDRVKERTANESEYLAEFNHLITLQQQKRDMVMRIEDPALRQKLARELGVDLGPQQLPPTYSDGYQNGRSLD